MEPPKSPQELLAMMQEKATDEERSILLKEMADKAPLVVLELLVSNAESTEARQSILTTLSLFRPELFQEYMEQSQVSVPESLDELVEIMEEMPDNHNRVMLLEEVKEENPDMFEEYFQLLRERNRQYE